MGFWLIPDVVKLTTKNSNHRQGLNKSHRVASNEGSYTSASSARSIAVSYNAQLEKGSLFFKCLFVLFSVYECFIYVFVWFLLL